MNMVTIAGIAVVTCMLAVTVRQNRQEFSAVIILLGGCAIAGVCLTAVSPTIKVLYELSSEYQLNEGFASVLKAVGICFITQTASDICKDCSCTALASKVETAGKIAVLAVIFPIFQSLLSMATEIING